MAFQVAGWTSVKLEDHVPVGVSNETHHTVTNDSMRKALSTLPTATVFDIANTSTQLVLLNTRKKGTYCHLRGRSQAEQERGCTPLSPDPERHFMNANLSSQGYFHRYCLDDENELFPVMPKKYQNPENWTNSYSRPSTGVNEERHRSCGASILYGATPPQTPRHTLPTLTMKCSSDVSVAGGQYRTADYQRRMSKAYDMENLKFLKTAQYTKLLERETKKGFYGADELRRYRRYLKTARKTGAPEGAVLPTLNQERRQSVYPIPLPHRLFKRGSDSVTEVTASHKESDVSYKSSQVDSTSQSRSSNSLSDSKGEGKSRPLSRLGRRATFVAGAENKSTVTSVSKSPASLSAGGASPQRSRRSSLAVSLGIDTRRVSISNDLQIGKKPIDFRKLFEIPRSTRIDETDETANNSNPKIRATRQGKITRDRDTKKRKEHQPPTRDAAKNNSRKGENDNNNSALKRKSAKDHTRMDESANSINSYKDTEKETHVHETRDKQTCATENPSGDAEQHSVATEIDRQESMNQLANAGENHITKTQNIDMSNAVSEVSHGSPSTENRIATNDNHSNDNRPKHHSKDNTSSVSSHDDQSKDIETQHERSNEEQPKNISNSDEIKKYELKEHEEDQPSPSGSEAEFVLDRENYLITSTTQDNKLDESLQAPLVSSQNLAIGEQASDDDYGGDDEYYTEESDSPISPRPDQPTPLISVTITPTRSLEDKPPTFIDNTVAETLEDSDTLPSTSIAGDKPLDTLEEKAVPLISVNETPIAQESLSLNTDNNDSNTAILDAHSIIVDDAHAKTLEHNLIPDIVIQDASSFDGSHDKSHSDFEMENFVEVDYSVRNESSDIETEIKLAEQQLSEDKEENDPRNRSIVIHESEDKPTNEMDNLPREITTNVVQIADGDEISSRNDANNVEVIGETQRSTNDSYVGEGYRSFDESHIQINDYNSDEESELMFASDEDGNEDRRSDIDVDSLNRKAEQLVDEVLQKCLAMEWVESVNTRDNDGGTLGESDRVLRVEERSNGDPTNRHITSDIPDTHNQLTNRGIADDHSLRNTRENDEIACSQIESSRNNDEIEEVNETGTQMDPPTNDDGDCDNGGDNGTGGDNISCVDNKEIGHYVTVGGRSGPDSEQHGGSTVIDDVNNANEQCTTNNIDDNVDNPTKDINLTNDTRLNVETASNVESERPTSRSSMTWVEKGETVSFEWVL